MLTAPEKLEVLNLANLWPRHISESGSYALVADNSIPIAEGVSELDENSYRLLVGAFNEEPVSNCIGIRFNPILHSGARMSLAALFWNDVDLVKDADLVS